MRKMVEVLLLGALALASAYVVAMPVAHGVRDSFERTTALLNDPAGALEHE